MKSEAKSFVVHFKRLDLGPPTGGCPNQIVLVGRSPAHVFWGISNLLCDLPCENSKSLILI